MIIGIDGNEANVDKRVGSGEYAFEILSNLAKISKDKLLVYLKASPKFDLPQAVNNLHYRVFGPKKFWTQAALPLNLYLNRPRPDVFFAPTHYAPRFCPVPVVVTIFDLSYIHFPELFRKSDLYQLNNWTKYSVEKASAIITISNSSKYDIASHYKINPKKIFVTYPGYDEKLFKPVKDKKIIEEIKKKYKISKNYLLFLGTIQPRKNLVRLVEAIEPFSDIQLVIVGKKGWLYDDFFQKIKHPKINKRIILTDFTPDDDLPALFSGAKAFVLPSLWEGFGIPALEAMACGCPTIVSNVSSLPEVVGDAGILIDPTKSRSIIEGIQKVLMNNNLAQDLSKRSLIRARKFSWKICAEETLEVLKNSSNVKVKV